MCKYINPIYSLLQLFPCFVISVSQSKWMLNSTLLNYWTIIGGNSQICFWSFRALFRVQSGIEHYIELKDLEMNDNLISTSSFYHHAPSNETRGMQNKLQTDEKASISQFEPDDSFTSTW
jgi:hypothetical protein